MSVGCCVYIVVLILCGRGSWYYNTIFCYPLGMLFGEYEQKVQMLLEKTDTYLMIVVCCAAAFAASYLCTLKCHGVIWLAVVELRGIFFVLLVVLATSRIKIGNPVLHWLGKHTFEIYILQRIPMILLQNRMGGYVYLLACLILTIGLAVIFKILERKVDTILKL